MTRSIAMVIAVSFALGGCGRLTGGNQSQLDATPGSTKNAARQTAGTDPTGATPGATFRSSVPGVRQAPLTLELSAECEEPGGSQSLAVTSEPGLRYSFNTKWPDGELHNDWGGWGLGDIPDSRTVAKEWRIPRDAPKGEAHNEVTVAGEIEGERAVTFGIVYWKIAESC